MTHGAVSRQLKSLDEYFGVALFTKSGRGLVLTHHGERLQSGVGEAFAKRMVTLLKHGGRSAVYLATPGVCWPAG